MKKIRIAIAAAAVAVTLLMTACNSGTESKFDFTMPDSPTEFVTTTIVDSEDESVKYPAVEFDGKTYVAYGTLDGDIEKSDVGSRLGYLVQDGQKLEEIGIFTLAADPDQNYLLSMDEKGIMENKTFFRNSETVGKDITTPSFIKSSDYKYWK